MGKHLIISFMYTRTPKLKYEILLLLNTDHYESDSKYYLPIVTTLPPTQILDRFNYVRSEENFSYRFLTICDCEIYVGSFSAGKLGFYFPSKSDLQYAGPHLPLNLSRGTSIELKSLREEMIISTSFFSRIYIPLPGNCYAI